MLPCSRTWTYGTYPACKEWRNYLSGPFVAETDHQRLEKIITQPNLSGQQACWVEVLANLELTIKYIPGTKNIVADSLSRRADLKINNIELSYITPEFKQKIQEAQHQSWKWIIKGITYPKQSILTKSDKNLIAKNKYQVQNDMLTTDTGQWCIPISSPELIKQVLQLYHDNPSASHPGQEKTTKLIQCHFFLDLKVTA